MLRKLTVIGVFLAALAPSAYLAWTLRTMPHLGFYHDDSIYWVSGRSLAMGDGYRIESLPGQPYQTKYPPLYPALLAGNLEGRSPVSSQSSAGHTVRLAAAAAVFVGVVGATAANTDSAGAGAM